MCLPNCSIAPNTPDIYIDTRGGIGEVKSKEVYNLELSKMIMFSNFPPDFMAWSNLKIWCSCFVSLEAALDLLQIRFELNHQLLPARHATPPKRLSKVLCVLLNNRNSVDLREIPTNTSTYINVCQASAKKHAGRLELILKSRYSFYSELNHLQLGHFGQKKAKANRFDSNRRCVFQLILFLYFTKVLCCDRHDQLRAVPSTDRHDESQTSWKKIGGPSFPSKDWVEMEILIPDPAWVGVSPGGTKPPAKTPLAWLSQGGKLLV